MQALQGLYYWVTTVAVLGLASFYFLAYSAAVTNFVSPESFFELSYLFVSFWLPDFFLDYSASDTGN